MPYSGLQKSSSMYRLSHVGDVWLVMKSYDGDVRGPSRSHNRPLDGGLKGASSLMLPRYTGMDREQMKTPMESSSSL